MNLAILLSALLVSEPQLPAPLGQWFDALLPSRVVEGEAVTRTDLATMMARTNVPGVQVTIIDDWQVVASGAYGMAATGRPVTTDTRFQAASISKPVASMAILALVEDGYLSLDAPVNNMLASWQVPAHEFSSDVTLRRLLSHTAGTTVSGFPGYPAGETLPTTVEILEGSGPANTGAVFVDKAPGEGHRYSGGGYTIAQLLAEEAANSNFSKIAEAEVLAPLGMTKSSFALTEEFPEAPLAHAYHANGAAYDGDYHRYPEQAAASLWTTADDIAKFAIALGRIASGAEGLPVTPATARMMMTPVDQAYGLGLGRGPDDAASRFGHSGSNAGYKTIFYFLPELGDGIVVLTNGDRGGEVMQAIVGTVADAMGWNGLEPLQLERAHLDAEALDEVAGTYRVCDDDYVLSVTGDRWALSGPDGIPDEGLPIAGDKLFFASENQLLDIERDEDGAATALTFRGSTFPKVDESD